MPNRLSILASRTVLCAAFFSLAAGVGDVAAQSARRGLVGRTAESPSIRRLAEAAPQKDIDLYVGRVVEKHGEHVIMNVLQRNSVKDRTPVYYACDIEMRPTAILQSDGIVHRACASFKTVSGTALVGDVVMVKYPAPEEEK